jgi:anti-anti-sigma factor
MGISKLLQQILLTFCLLPTVFCFLAFAQGGTGKLPPRRNLPPPPIRNPPMRKNPPARISDLRISERRVRDIVILDLDGKITAREGGPALRNAIGRLIRDGKKKILLNLSKVSSIDASEAEEIVSTHSSVEKDEGQLKLCGLTRNVRDQFERGSQPGTIRLVDFMLMNDTFEKEQDALSGFR